MGLTYKHALGRNTDFFVNPEAAFDTFVKPAGTDAVKALKITINPTVDRKDRADANGTRDTLERITGRSSVDWSTEHYLCPSGYRGEAPDVGDLLKCAFGVATATKDVGTITVVGYANGSTDTLTVTIDGTAHVLTEGTDFDAETSDEVTAGNIQTVVDALTGVTATVADDVVTVTADAGVNTLDLATGDATAWTATVNDGEVVYSLSDTQGVLGSVALIRNVDELVMDAVSGCWVEEVKITLSGGDEPKLAFSGGGATHIHTSATVLDGALSGEKDPIIDDEYAVEVGSVIKIGSDDNSGAGHDVTAKVGTQLTITDNATADNDAEITPFTPTATTGGSPLAGISGALTIDTVAFPITQIEVTLKNNIKPINDEYGSAVVTDVIEGKRNVSGSINCRARRDQVIELGNRKGFATRAIVVTAGSVAGALVSLSIPYAEIEFSPFEVPESDECTFSLPFRGLGSTGADSISLTLY